MSTTAGGGAAATGGGAAQSNVRLTGADFLRHPHFNKGAAFTREERDWLQISPLLPPYVDTLDTQVDRVISQIRQDDKTPLQRYAMLRQIQDSNVVLFYAIVSRDPVYFMPLIYTPTVGEACQKFNRVVQAQNHGVYLSYADRGRLAAYLSQYRAQATTDMDVIVVTDGSRILGLGDLGVNGMGIPIGKTSLYVVGAGINPRKVLPITLDFGTDNQELLADPTYSGLRQTRDAVPDDDYYAFTDEFMAACRTVFPHAVVQFEDFSNNHCFTLLERYRNQQLCFNDDIQGTGAVVAAGFYNAIRLSGVPVDQHRLLVLGAGSAAVGVVAAIVQLLAHKFRMSPEDLRSRIYLFDTKGVVTTTRGDRLAEHKVAWARKDIPAQDNVKYQTLMDAVRHIRPTALIGLSTQKGAFTREIVEMMLMWAPRPILFPLSNPSSKAEIVPGDAYTWTNGSAICASGSPFPAVTIDTAGGNSRTMQAAQGNNMYVFPGIGLACVVARARSVSEDALMRAAAALADMVSDEDLRAGTDELYPPLTQIRRVSAHVAASVIMQFQAERVCGPVAETGPLPTSFEGLADLCSRHMWVPVYENRDFYTRHYAGAKL